MRSDTGTDNSAQMSTKGNLKESLDRGSTPAVSLNGAEHWALSTAPLGPGPSKTSQFKKKKIWNRVDCQCSEKKIKNKGLKKKSFLIEQNKIKCAIFWGNPLFQSYVQHKNKQFTYLFPVGFLRRKRARDWRVAEVHWTSWAMGQSHALFLPQESSWQKISTLFEPFACF